MAVTDTAAREAGRLIGCRALFGSDVALSQPFPGRPPLWIEPVDPALRRDIGAAVRWMDSHHADIEDALIAFGAIVWRGFPVSGPDGFAALMGRFTPYAQGYTAGTTDRQAIKGQVMEATRTPPEVYIFPHQEMSYLASNPRLVAFYCAAPSPQGGETVICDMRGVLEALPEAVARKFIEDGVLYRRNMRSDDVDDWRAAPVYRHPDWQYRFGTRDRAVVEAQLAERGISYEWLDDGSLNFWTHRPGVTTHPVTGERLLFNQLHSQSQHRLSVGAARADLVDVAYGASATRPYSVAFGTGEPPTDEEFSSIHAEMESRKVAFPWRAGDVMLVENKLTAHGRHPFVGDRDIQVMLLD